MPPFFRAFHALTVDNTGAGTRLPLSLLPTPLQCGMNLPQGAVRLPALKVIKDRTSGWKVRRNRAPLTPGTQHIQQAIEHCADVHGPLASSPSRGWNKGRELGPLFLGHIAGISQLGAVVAGTCIGQP